MPYLTVGACWRGTRSDLLTRQLCLMNGLMGGVGSSPITQSLDFNDPGYWNKYFDLRALVCRSLGKSLCRRTTSPNGLNIFNINWRKLRNGQSLPLKVYLDAPAAGYGLNISNDHWRGAETAEAFKGLRSVPPATTPGIGLNIWMIQWPWLLGIFN